MSLCFRLPLLALRWMRDSNAGNKHVFVGDLAGNSITIVDNNIVIGHPPGVHSVLARLAVSR